jgi:hypothetical protein
MALGGGGDREESICCNGGSEAHRVRPPMAEQLAATDSVVRRCSGELWGRDLHGKAMGNVKHGDGEAKRKNGGEDIARRCHRRSGKSGRH